MMIGAGLVFLAVVLVSYQATVEWIDEFWFKEGGIHVHGPVLVLLIAYLLWDNRVAWMYRAGPSTSLWWLALLGAAVLWLLAWAAEMYPLQVLSLFGVMLSGLCLIVGEGSWRTFAPRFGLIIFALPVWFNILPPLQAIATFGSQAILNLFGLVIFVEDIYVHTSVGTFEIAGGCAGLGLFLVSLCLAGYLAFTHATRPIQTVMLFLGAALLGIVANWIRISIIIAVGYFYGIEHPLVSDHGDLGWIVYAVVGFPFMILVSRRLEQSNPVDEVVTQRQSAASGFSTPTPLFLMVGVLVIALIGPAIVIRSDAQVTQARSIQTPSLPGFQSVDQRPLLVIQEEVDETTAWYPEGIRSTYVMGASRLTYAAVHYPDHRADQPVPRFLDSLYGEDWRPLNETRTAVIDGPTEQHYQEVILRDQFSDARRLFRYWYELGGQPTIQEKGQRIRLAMTRLRGQRDLLTVSISTECEQVSCANARLLLDRWLSAGDSVN